MHRKRYVKYPEFNGLGEVVLKYLETPGETIQQMLGSKKDGIHPDNLDFVDKPVWHNKGDLDRFVQKELNLRMEDYGTGKKNPLYQAVAKEISYLRKNDVIVDLLHNPRINLHKGKWRLARKLDDVAKTRAVEEMCVGNFYSQGIETTVFVREKRDQFRKYLLERDCRCLFCKFDLKQWMIGAHIVPYSTMRREDPNNSMNPSNGLLLCRTCDVAFEYGYILVESDYGITVTDRLRDVREDSVKSWLSSVRSELCINKNARCNPDRKYLEEKKKRELFLDPNEVPCEIFVSRM